MSLIIVCFSFPFCLRFAPGNAKARPVKVWLFVKGDSSAVVVGSGSFRSLLFVFCPTLETVQTIFHDHVIEPNHADAS